jgi:hypothetical protein
MRAFSIFGTMKGQRMKIVVYLLGIVLFVVLAFGLYVRLAPTDVARWHQPITAVEDADLPGGAIRVIAADDALWAEAGRTLQALPRTHVVAGSADEGRITYVTRSALWGFPDYTTVEYGDDTLKLFARLRFGGSDMGVNAKRLERVLSALKG